MCNITNSKTKYFIEGYQTGMSIEITPEQVEECETLEYEKVIDKRYDWVIYKI